MLAKIFGDSSESKKPLVSEISKPLVSDIPKKPLVSPEPPKPAVPEIKDRMVKLNVQYVCYKYDWSTVVKHKNWLLYKRIIEKGQINAPGYSNYSTCPEIYAYVNRYILHGAKLDLDHISQRLGCSKDAIIAAIKTQGFDEQICIPETLPVAPTTEVPSPVEQDFGLDQKESIDDVLIPDLLG